LARPVDHRGEPFLGIGTFDPVVGHELRCFSVEGYISRQHGMA